jgi:hypothetical protein
MGERIQVNPWLLARRVAGPGRKRFAIATRARELDIPFAGHVPFLVRAADAAAAGQRSNEHLFGVLEGCSSDEGAVLAEFARSMAAAQAKDIGTLVGIMLERVRRSVATQDDDACRRLAQVFIENETWQVPTLVSLRGKVYPRELTAAAIRARDTSLRLRIGPRAGSE